MDLAQGAYVPKLVKTKIILLGNCFIGDIQRSVILLLFSGWWCNLPLWH